MSASLVGSEMCIRDRAAAAPQRPPKSDSSRGMPELSGAIASGRTSGGAVSYTHLTLPTICSV
eukprot:2684336-Alexandrium_andersonii.AAC.1